MQRVLTEIQNDEVLVCDECKGSVIVVNGSFTCTSCGLIIAKSMVNNKVTSRTVESWVFLEGSPFDLSAGSYIYGDIHKDKYWRSRVINQEKNQYLIQHYRLIDRICKYLDLPEKICLRTMQIFYTLSKTDIAYQNPVLIAVSLTKATSEEFYPLKPKEILDILKEFDKKVTRSVLNRCLIDLNIKIPSYSPRDYVPRYLSIFKAKFPNYTETTMLYQLLDLYKPFFNNSRPSVYAFCCIVISFNVEYHLSRNGITKLYRDNPSSYYNLFDRILARYNKQHKTFHSFS